MHEKQPSYRLNRSTVSIYSLVRTTEIEREHTVNLGTFCENRKNLMSKGGFRVELFNIIKGTMHIVGSSYGISPFSFGLHQPEHMFYINMFFREDKHES